ncbi:MAG: class I SAM-dependent methyltransferase [Candidatus Woesebacteria bacterium]
MQQTQSWDHVASWYDSLVGGKGQYYHQHVIFPSVLKLMEIKAGLKVLDLACGQGAFCRELVKLHAKITGVDASSRMIETAKKYAMGVEYIVDDARTLRSQTDQSFDRVVSILALQNMDPIDGVFSRVRDLLRERGTFTIVILHPAFRSPRITGWGEDEARKLQFRRVDRYISPMKIPIDMHPGKGTKQLTWTYHRPLQTYVQIAKENGFVIDGMEELISDKVSEGKHAKQENLARQEIPMFMTLRFRKSV